MLSHLMLLQFCLVSLPLVHDCQSFLHWAASMIILNSKSDYVTPLPKISAGISITYIKSFKSVLRPLSLAWSGPGCLSDLPLLLSSCLQTSLASWQPSFLRSLLLFSLLLVMLFPGSHQGCLPFIIQVSTHMAIPGHGPPQPERGQPPLVILSCVTSLNLPHSLFKT